MWQYLVWKIIYNNSNDIVWLQHSTRDKDKPKEMKVKLEASNITYKRIPKLKKRDVVSWNSNFNLMLYIFLKDLYRHT